uniref:Uncharacterized protein n=1 Tax=Fibrocapsa japonica TaxID=94617 RepID=A0A7S2V3R0_9STRA|mmetsp:Transcript_5700/g.8628  ORF Transcript_5700/g.8628 Transcript_5700/m.8628 type:complete len:208 (+) Transcript_5700:152-775(+)|eukprot:CAMPEP_0113936136 /NCGR_PEP_ID=MMETSP1339-20121228/3111_1 /TAXON_ID=94617 /ORGANISM="Fibrocapsa japonica" /LENGTH=207 /DNA_ID=CAMNT_0000938495 /DNA_START=113 /DNA_END=736 /DNA_ORIENTATION=+ /assembly_acc=CAM_ASM_000762
MKKRTMVKDQIGAVRSTTYDLPTDEFVYGSKVAKDNEGAGAVLSKWVVGTPSQPKESQQSFIKTNRAAINQGNITAKAQREFALAHPDITFTPPALRRERELAESKRTQFDGPFGIRTNDGRESINELIQAKFTSFQGENHDYPDMAGMKKKGALPKPRNTAAATGHLIVAQQKVSPPQQKEYFKMKKFQNVAPKIDRQGNVNLGGR